LAARRGKSFKAIGPYDLFLFKLHSPLNYIAGGGLFVRYATLPVSLAWDAFREKMVLGIIIAFAMPSINIAIQIQ